MALGHAGVLGRLRRLRRGRPRQLAHARLPRRADRGRHGRASDAGAEPGVRQPLAELRRRGPRALEGAGLGAGARRHVLPALRRRPLRRRQALRLLALPLAVHRRARPGPRRRGREHAAARGDDADLDPAPADALRRPGRPAAHRRLLPRVVRLHVRVLGALRAVPRAAHADRLRRRGAVRPDGPVVVGGPELRRDRLRGEREGRLPRAVRPDRARDAVEGAHVAAPHLARAGRAARARGLRPALSPLLGLGELHTRTAASASSSRARPRSRGAPPASRRPTTRARTSRSSWTTP